MEEKQPFHSGFVALVGRPNAGKSTLLNACLGYKLAITSDVAQTTRKRMRAVITTEDSQLVIVDTPGLHKPKDALGKELNRAALSELADVDVVAFLVDATQPVGRGDAWVASHVEACEAYKLLVITKADLVEQAQALEQLRAAQELAHFDDVLVTSATENFNVDAFLQLVGSHVPEGPKWFGDGMDVDMDEEELVAEFVREQVLLKCRDEIPHSVAVSCEDMSFAKDGHASIRCRIFCERESQKGIIIGAGGKMIRSIGTSARHEIERFLDCKAYLELEVEVRPLWRRDANEIRRLGYDAGE